MAEVEGLLVAIVGELVCTIRVVKNEGKFTISYNFQHALYLTLTCHWSCCLTLTGRQLWKICFFIVSLIHLKYFDVSVYIMIKNLIDLAWHVVYARLKACGRMCWTW